MAKEKKPSIYSDRGTIGSSEELDEYGVWVKSEPEDFTSEEVETPEFNADFPDGEDLDFSIPEIEDLPDLGPVDEKASDDFSLAELPEDDFDIPDIGSGGETEKTSLISGDSGGDDLNLGDITEESGLDSLEIPDLEVPADSGGLESPVELTGLDESGLEDDLDFPKIDGQDQESLSLDTGISLDTPSIDTSMDDLIENFDSEEEALPGGSMGLDSDAVDEAFTASAAPTQTEIRQEAGFTAVTGSPKDSGLTAPSSSADLSTQLLMKIAEELSSIRAELSSLKKEFSVIRAGAPAAETEEGGFFDKEDDEKIALTGDELNNILNTADFTEETGTDVTMEPADDDTGEHELPTVPDVEAATDSASQEPPEEDIVFSPEAVAGISVEEIGENEGKPVTHELTTEDTNYLAREAAVGIIDPTGIEEATIDVPDLSVNVDTENPVLENITSEEPVEAGIAAEEPVTQDITADDLGDLGIAAEEPVDAGIAADDLGDLNIIPEEPVSTDTTSDDLGDLGIATEEPVTQDITADDLGDLGIAAEEPVDAGIAADDLGDLNIIPEEPVSTDTTSDELGDLGIAAEEPVTQDITADDLGDLNITPEEPGSTDVTSDELGDLDISSEDIGDLEIGTDELGDLDINTDELGNLGINAEEPTAEEPVAEALSTEAPVAEEADTGELSILELGADDFDLAEPVLEELSTGPAEEEPVSEDFGILAADEHDEDFGVLVVDEPSGETAEAAEEIHEEPAAQEAVSADTQEISAIPGHLKQELKTVLSYMDQLLEALPDEKIEEFARSEYYDTYKKLFKDLGIA